VASKLSEKSSKSVSSYKEGTSSSFAYGDRKAAPSTFSPSLKMKSPEDFLPLTPKKQEPNETSSTPTRRQMLSSTKKDTSMSVLIRYITTFWIGFILLWSDFFLVDLPKAKGCYAWEKIPEEQWGSTSQTLSVSKIK